MKITVSCLPEKLGLEFYVMGKEHETRAQICFFSLWPLKIPISICSKSEVLQ